LALTAAQKFLVLVHAALVVAFLAYTLVFAYLFVRQAETGYISEGAQAVVGVGVVTVSCAALLTVGVVLWARTGLRRFPVVADGIVIGLSWTVLVVLVFLQPILYVAVLGLMLLCPLVAIVVPGPARRR
jgi:hypothetical protein